MKLVGSGQYDALRETVQLDRCELTSSDQFTLSTEGRIAQLFSRCEVDLKGRASYDLAKLLERIVPGTRRAHVRTRHAGVLAARPLVSAGQLRPCSAGGSGDHSPRPVATGVVWPGGLAVAVRGRVGHPDRPGTVERAARRGNAGNRRGRNAGQSGNAANGSPRVLEQRSTAPHGGSRASPDRCEHHARHVPGVAQVRHSSGGGRHACRRQVQSAA